MLCNREDRLLAYAIISPKKHKKKCRQAKYIMLKLGFNIHDKWRRSGKSLKLPGPVGHIEYTYQGALVKTRRSLEAIYNPKSSYYCDNLIMKEC